MKISFRYRDSVFPHLYTDLIPFDQHDHSVYDVFLGDKLVGTTQDRAKIVIQFFKHGFRGYKVKDLMPLLDKDITMDQLLNIGNMVL